MFPSNLGGGGGEGRAKRDVSLEPRPKDWRRPLGRWEGKSLSRRTSETCSRFTSRFARPSPSRWFTPNLREARGFSREPAATPEACSAACHRHCSLSQSPTGDSVRSASLNENVLQLIIWRGFSSGCLRRSLM